MISTLLASLALASPCSAAPAVPIQHIVMVVEENKAYQQVIGSANAPYLNDLATHCTLATDYHGITHPSLPNYIALTSGSTGGFTTDCPATTCTDPDNNIFHQLGSDWNVWAESQPSPCRKSGGSNNEYNARHTAAPYYTDIPASVCAAQDPVQPTGNLPSTPTTSFTLAIPNACHDMHGSSRACPQTSTQQVVEGDKYLSQWLPTLLASTAYKGGSTLIEITWDSDTDKAGNTNHIPLILLNPALAAGSTLTRTYTHYSLLRLNEELTGQPLLQNAAAAADMRPALPF
jgi:hypothetical protein